MSAKDETNQSAPARKKIKLNEQASNLTTKKSCRIKELTSRLVELSNEYQELNDLNEFDELVKILKIKQNELENEERCPLYQLPHEVFNNCISFLDKSYGFVAPVSKRFQETYNQVFKGNKETVTDFRGLSKEAGVYLIESFPETSFLVDKNEFYQFFFGKKCDMLFDEEIDELDFSVKDYLVHKAAQHGNLDVFRHVFEKGYDLLFAQDEAFFLYQKIAENGHLHILQYLKEEYYFFYGFCRSVDGAIKGGHIHILKWLKELGCFDDVNRRNVVKFAKMAAECGQLEVLKYFKQNVDFYLEFSLLDEALKSKSVEILRCCHAQRDDYFQGVDEDKIIKTGKVEIVKYFVENRGVISERSTDLASRYGHLDVLKYLISKNIDWDVDAFGYRAFHFEIVKFGYEKYRRWCNSSIFRCLLQKENNFNADMLKYLRRNNCPWGGQGATFMLIRSKQIAILEHLKDDVTVPSKNLIFKYAVRENWFDGMRYMLDNGIECDLPSLNSIGMSFMNIEVLKYCKGKGLNWETGNEVEHLKLLKRAATAKDLDSFKWIFTNLEHQWSQKLEIMDFAPCCEYRNDFLEYLHQIGCVSKPADFETAVRGSNLKALNFLHSHYYDPGLYNDELFEIACNNHNESYEDEGERKEVISFLLKTKCPQSYFIDSYFRNW